jgi:hypothetical protein
MSALPGLRLPSRSKTAALRTLWPFGLASALVYLLGFTLPYWFPTHYLNVKDEIYQFVAREPWRGVLFYVALAALFVCYLAAYRQTAGRGLSWSSARWVGFWAVIFCLLLIPIQPVTSSDIYGYLFQGRIVAVLGENPFAHLYADFQSDPFYFWVTFHRLPAVTGYGPLWIAITAGLGWLARERMLFNLVLLKGMAAGLHLLSSLLVFATLKRLGSDKGVAAMLFYAWNPVLLYELVGNGHNDAVVAFLALLGFYCLSREWWWWAIPCLSAAALVKPVVVLWLPLVAVWLLAQCPNWPVRVVRAAALAALAILPAVVAYAPFWVGTSTFQGLLAQSDIHGNSLPNLLIWGLWEAWPGFERQVVQGVKLLTAVLLALFYLWQLGRIWLGVSRPASTGEGKVGRPWQSLLRAGFDVMLFYLLFAGFQFWPWYLTWIMIPAAVLDEPAFSIRHMLALVLGAGSLLLYFPFGWQWAQSRWPGWGLALGAALPMLGLCAWLAIHLLRSRQRADGGLVPKK